MSRREIAKTLLVIVSAIHIQSAAAWSIPYQYLSHSRPPGIEAPSRQVVEVGFSPNAGAEDLVLKTIETAKTSIRLAAYSFTSPSIVRALIVAKNRGVDVAVIIDYKQNMECRNYDCPGKHAAQLVYSAGIPIKSVSRYPIFHHKFIVADGLQVETGSFNFSTSAATRNAENAIVIWNNPGLANSYLARWQQYWSEADPIQMSY